MIPDAPMLRLCFGLCAALFLVLLIAGEDTGQTRAGLRPAAKAIPVKDPTRLQDPPPSELPLVLPLVTAPPPDSPRRVRYVLAEVVNLREGPSTEYPVVGRLQRGAPAELLWTEGNGWARVALADGGVSGYVAAALLSETAP